MINHESNPSSESKDNAADSQPDAEQCNEFDDLRKAGVQRMEAIASQLGKPEKVMLAAAVVLTSFTFNFYYTTSATYRGYATAEFREHSLLATIGTVNYVVAAIGQPVVAKVADIFGRWEMLAFGLIMSIAGNVIEAAAKNLGTFAAGNVFGQLGFTTTWITLFVIIADVSNLNPRMLFNYGMFSPLLIVAWVGPYIVADILEHSTWRWGFGMFAILTPATTIPLIGILLFAERKAMKAKTIPPRRPISERFSKAFVTALFHQVDAIGMVLMTITLALTLVPLTLGGTAGGGTAEFWRQAQTLAPLTIGIIVLPVFLWWETQAPYPLVPFELLRDRGVWPAMLFATVFNAAWVVQSTYLYPALIVSFNQSILSATRISIVAYTSNILVGAITGALIVRIKRAKPFILLGSAVFMVAYGLQIKWTSGIRANAIIASQVLIGAGMGMCFYSSEVSVNARSKHENVAVIIGLFLGTSYAGSAIGSAIAGAVWTQMLPSRLELHLGPAFAVQVFADPYSASAEFAVGTPERSGMIDAYSQVTKVLNVIGLCLAGVVFLCGCLLRNTELVAIQTNSNAELDDTSTSSSERGWWRRFWA